MRTQLRIVCAVMIVFVLVLAGSASAQLRKKTGAREGKAVSTTSETAGGQQAGTQVSALDKALALLARWRHADAREQLKGTENDSSVAAAWGLLLVEEGRRDDGLVQLRTAKSSDPADPAPPYWLGEALYLGGDYSGATADWTEAARRAEALLAAQKGDARASFYLGAAKVRLKQFDPARSALETAAEGGWDGPMVSYQKGLSRAFAKEWQDAIKDLTATVEADPTYAHAWYYRALCWDKIHRTDRMLEDFEHFVQLAPDAPEAERARSILSAAGH